MRGSKLIILSLLFLASNVFAQPTATISNIVYSSVFQETNWPYGEPIKFWNFSKLTNMNNAQVVAMLRRDGFHLAGANAGDFQVASNSICITNIPGISGAGLFMNGNYFNGADGRSNAPAIYMSYSNPPMFAIGGPFVLPRQDIQRVEVVFTWVTNGATSVNVQSYSRAINLTAMTNNMMAVGDAFSLTGYCLHHNYFPNTIQFLLSTNGLSGPYMEEDSFGRMWIDENKFGQQGGAMAVMGDFPNANIPWHGTRWKAGWEMAGPTTMRVWAGPNRYIRTLNGLTRFYPFRSMWVETIAQEVGTNRCLQPLIHSIAIYGEPLSSLPPVMLETNNANPYELASYRGNVVTGNEGSFNNASVANSPTNSTNAVNLAALQNALRTNGAVGSVTQTNFNLLQIYTNGSGLVQAYSGRIGLNTAAVNGNAGVLAFLSRDNGTTFSAVGGVSIGTTLAVTLAQAYTNTYFFALNTNDQCYFTNISSGDGNSAGLVAGSGQVTLMGASIASLLTNQNAVSAQYLAGDTNLTPFVYTIFAGMGASAFAAVITNGYTGDSPATPTGFQINAVWVNTATINTNQFGVNFGKVFSRTPYVTMTYVNAQTNSQNMLANDYTMHIAASSVTRSNFNVCSGNSAHTAGTTNTFQFIVTGGQ